MSVQEGKVKDKYGILASQFIGHLAPVDLEVRFGASKTDTLWAQQSFVYASADAGADRQRAFQNLLLGRLNSCVLISERLKEAQRLYPMAADKSYGDIPRIFNTGESRWSKDKVEVFLKYKYVIVINPKEEEPMAELAVSLGEDFSRIRDNTHFIINRTGW